MSGVLEYPKLRWPIEIRVEKFEKQEVIIILCPIGLSKTPLALIATVAPILQCFEGSLSVQQIVEKFAAQGLTEQIVRELIQLLDDNLFLATPRFFSAQQAMHEEFTNSDTRPTALAGLSYSLGKEALTLEVDGYLSKNKPIVKPRLQKLNCLIATHID